MAWNDPHTFSGTPGATSSAGLRRPSPDLLAEEWKDPGPLQRLVMGGKDHLEIPKTVGKVPFLTTLLGFNCSIMFYSILLAVYPNFRDTHNQKG